MENFEVFCQGIKLSANLNFPTCIRVSRNKSILQASLRFICVPNSSACFHIFFYFWLDIVFHFNETFLIMRKIDHIFPFFHLQVCMYRKLKQIREVLINFESFFFILGTQIRKRFCGNPTPIPPGKDCRGKKEEKRKCMVKKCPGKLYWEKFLH